MKYIPSTSLHGNWQPYYDFLKENALAPNDLCDVFAKVRPLGKIDYWGVYANSNVPSNLGFDCWIEDKRYAVTITGIPEQYQPKFLIDTGEQKFELLFWGGVHTISSIP